MNKLFVDYEYVNSTAARNINTYRQTFHEQWEQVFNQFHNIDNAWDGVDNDVYNQKFASLRKDFEAMDTYLDNLHSYLVKSANDYKQKQTEIQNAAKQLKS